ncbi:MAG: hypothetical protein ACRD3W_10615, partial [Terriglobales bacterium]
MAKATRATTQPKKVTYELFHSIGDFFWISLQYGDRSTTAKDLQKAFSQGHYELVHSFTLPSKGFLTDLDIVFEKSQNIERSWRGKAKCRSTSVGDLIRIEN